MPLNITPVNEVDLGLVKKKLIRVNKTDKKGQNVMITVDDIKDMNDIMKKKVGDKGSYYIVLHGIGNVYFNAKSLDGELDLDEIEDYFMGRVKDTGKFCNEYFSMSVGFVIKNDKIKN